MLEFNEAWLNQSDKFKESVSEFKERIMERRIPLHGFLCLKGKDILCEEYFYPYSKESLHRMYSITKSFTSLAIGLLEKEGLINLDDNIYKYFQEYDENNLHPWFKELTIRQMLSMQTCFYKTTYKETDYNWAESYFTTKPDHKPGTVFSYDTSSSQVLAALVEKLTGMSLLDYLRLNGLNDLGFSKNAYVLTDPSGTSQGGTGLNCTLRDIAKVAYTINHFGIVDGREYFPSKYVKEAIKKQVPTSVLFNVDEACGYGYMFWRLRKNGFVMYGMGGQLAMCFPDSDVVMLTVADTIGIGPGLQTIYDAFYDTLYKSLIASSRCNPSIESLDLYEGEYTVTESSLNFKKLSVKNNKVIFTTKDDKIYSFSIDLNKKITQNFCDTKYTCVLESHAEMKHLFMKCFLTDFENGHFYMDLFYKDKNYTIRFENTSSPLFKDFKGIMTAVKENND